MTVSVLSLNLQDKLADAYGDPNNEVPVGVVRPNTVRALLVRDLIEHARLRVPVEAVGGEAGRTHGYVLSVEGVAAARCVVEERAALEVRVEGLLERSALVPARERLTGLRMVVRATTYTSYTGEVREGARLLKRNVTALEVREMLRISVQQGVPVEALEGGVLRIGVAWMVPNAVTAYVEPVGGEGARMWAVTFEGGADLAGTVARRGEERFPEWAVFTTGGSEVVVRPKAELLEAVSGLARACKLTGAVTLVECERGWGTAQAAAESPRGVTAPQDAPLGVGDAQGPAQDAEGRGFVLYAVGPLLPSAAEAAAARVVDSAAAGYEETVILADGGEGPVRILDAVGALRIVRNAGEQMGRRIEHDDAGSVRLVSERGFGLVLRPVSTAEVAGDLFLRQARAFADLSGVGDGELTLRSV
jgi:hypothetical protein